MPKVEQRPSLQTDEGTKLAPIRLSNVVIDIRRGTRIGSYRFTALVCKAFTDYVIWNQGRIKVTTTEFIDRFHETLTGANYNVVGDPKRLFREARGEPEPAFIVGGRIEMIAMDVCDRMHWFYGHYLGMQGGKVTTRVAWQVYDTLNRRIVYETKTEGTAEIVDDQAIPDGELALIYEGFAAAAANLAADPGFFRLLSQPRSDRSAAAVRPVAADPVRFRPEAEFRTPIAEHMDHVRLGVVTLSSGSGHGSGFFISPRLILTNHHVVRGRDIVRVELVTGRKVLGEVLRSHPQRDVALVSVEAGGHRPLPIRTRPAVIGEDVYAIGTPLHQSLSGSVTKGIVSAYRSNEAGFEDIQVDVDIQPGNSGGPLLDASGNVIGISYAGIGGTGRSVGLNLFVPLGDAIRMLGLNPEDPQTGRPTASR